MLRLTTTIGDDDEFARTAGGSAHATITHAGTQRKQPHRIDMSRPQEAPASNAPAEISGRPARTAR